MLSERSGGHERLERSGDLEIKGDDKFYWRVMSKESSLGNCSCRVYYGGVCGTVPFMWESQPGTPKHPSSHTTPLPLPPPLTPPPSYHSSRNNSNSNRKKMKPTILTFIFRRRKTQGSPSSSFSSLSSPNLHARTCFPCSRSPVHNCTVDFEEEEDRAITSPTSTLCFRGCQSMAKMKKALLSILTPAQGTA